MTNEQIIETFSTLPVAIIDDIRFSAAVAINANPLAFKINKRQKELIEMCNRALELKDAQRLSGMDSIDIDYQFV